MNEFHWKPRGPRECTRKHNAVWNNNEFWQQTHEGNGRCHAYEEFNAALEFAILEFKAIYSVLGILAGIQNGAS